MQLVSIQGWHPLSMGQYFTVVFDYFFYSTPFHQCICYRLKHLLFALMEVCLTSLKPYIAMLSKIDEEQLLETYCCTEAWHLLFYLVYTIRFPLMTFLHQITAVVSLALFSKVLGQVIKLLINISTHICTVWHDGWVGGQLKEGNN